MLLALPAALDGHRIRLGRAPSAPSLVGIGSHDCLRLKRWATSPKWWTVLPLLGSSGPAEHSGLPRGQKMVGPTKYKSVMSKKYKEFVEPKKYQEMVPVQSVPLSMVARPWWTPWRLLSMVKFPRDGVLGRARLR